MPIVHFKRGRDPVELPEDKASLVATAHEEFLRTGVDRSIKLPGGGLEMVSQVLRIVADVKKTETPFMTRREAEAFSETLKPFMHEGKFDFESQLRYLESSNVVKVRQWPVGKRAASMCDVEFGVVLENANSYREVCDRVEQWLYIQGRIAEEKRLEAVSLDKEYGEVQEG